MRRESMIVIENYWRCLTCRWKTCGKKDAHPNVPTISTVANANKDAEANARI